MIPSRIQMEDKSHIKRIWLSRCQVERTWVVDLGVSSERSEQLNDRLVLVLDCLVKRIFHVDFGPLF
jgi:hypothetical protein